MDVESERSISSRNAAIETQIGRRREKAKGIEIRMRGDAVGKSLRSREREGGGHGQERRRRRRWKGLE